jgi:hypothetical protein
MPRGRYSRKIKKIEEVIGPSIAYVPLSRGFFALIDSEMSGQVGKYNWCATMTPKGPRPIGAQGLRRRSGIYLSRFLLDTPAQDIDHANNNPLDNRMCNLRPATRVQNRRNSRAVSPLKGTSFVARKGKYRGHITVEGKTIHLGYFSTREGAHAAYCSAAIQYFGEFARFA